jgi:hypothetical protein
VLHFDHLMHWVHRGANARCAGLVRAIYSRRSEGGRMVWVHAASLPPRPPKSGAHGAQTATYQPSPPFFKDEFP